jgi:DNA-binding MarR family transcriptional regulator
MRVVTSIMRVQQLLLTRIDGLLKPFGLTFARYEVLVLLSFSRVGALPLSTIGERLQVHPTSVTNAIDRLESAGLVTRTPDDTDRRRTLAVLTDQGRATLAKATGAVTAQQFFLDGLTDDDADALYRMLRGLRFSCGDLAAD